MPKMVRSLFRSFPQVIIDKLIFCKLVVSNLLNQRQHFKFQWGISIKDSSLFDAKAYSFENINFQKTTTYSNIQIRHLIKLIISILIKTFNLKARKIKVQINFYSTFCEEQLIDFFFFRSPDTSKLSGSLTFESKKTNLIIFIEIQNYEIDNPKKKIFFFIKKNQII